MASGFSSLGLQSGSQRVGILVGGQRRSYRHMYTVRDETKNSHYHQLEQKDQ